jgi:predicted naringenin-chalcone synthase
MAKSSNDNDNYVYLHGIATAVPEQWYSQDFALDFFLSLDGMDDRQRKFMKKIYAGSAIEKRHTVIDDYHKDPSEFTFYPPNKHLKPEPTTTQRNDLFIQAANRLSLDAVQKLFRGLPSADTSSITHLITVSCTGFSAPGFDMHLVKELSLAPSTRRYHIGFMGCYAALTGMSMAQTICRAEPDARVLLVNVELCSLHFQQKYDLDTMVANAIFSDGVSAALISAHEEDSTGNRISLDVFRSQYLNDSEKDMAWKLGDTGFDMKLSAYVPRIIYKNIDEILEGILSKSQFTAKDIDIWAVHPGGKAILEKVEQSVGLQHSDLQVSYDVLKEYGNMSSATIMFVLQRILHDDRSGNILALAFGPGLTVETGLLRKTV